VDPSSSLFEHDPEAATPIPEMRKPFDVLAEGLLLKIVGTTGFEHLNPWWNDFVAQSHLSGSACLS
jgi:hypothetical protein